MADKIQSGGSEDEEGIHFVSDKMANKMTTAPVRREVCVKCGSPATCMGRLYVPASKLSMNAAAEDVSALLCGLTYCDRHFAIIQANPGQFLIPGIMATIDLEFKKRNAYPNFKKAVIGRIPIADPDFARGQKAAEVARKS